MRIARFLIRGVQIVYCQTRTSFTKTESPVRILRRKAPVGKKIVSQLPPHGAWIEAFYGSAAVTLAKKAAPIEIINDHDRDVVNLFEQLRDNPDRLCKAIAFTPYARDEYRKARSNGTVDPLERARRFLVATMMTINGTYNNGSGGFSISQSYSRDNREARVSRWYNLPDRLAVVVERLRSVRIENRDARDLVRTFSDRPATLMYLDPP